MKNQGRKVGSKNFTYDQRLQLEALLLAKVSKREIARILCKNESTIYREIKRGLYDHKIRKLDYVDYKEYFVKRYSAYIAQEKYELNCTAKGAREKLGNDYEFVDYVEKRILEDGLTACAVIGEIKRNNLPFRTQISKPTLYRYIAKGYIFNVSINVPKKKKVKAKKQAKTAPRGRSIEQRPIEVLNRTNFGHWEMDCVCGPTKACVLTMVERSTRMILMFKLKNKKVDSIVSVLNKLEYKYGKKFKSVFKTITVDNGVEFSNTESMEQSIYGRGKNQRTVVYHCHPYCSSERGSNERLNREVRRRLPKKTNFLHVSDEEILAVEKWVNNYPRQVLGYATSEELFFKELEKIA